MESVMREMVGTLVPGGISTPLAKAQDILLQAYRETDENRRARLAKDALEICPDCADAYVLLAEQARSRKEALGLYEQGVAAGACALAPEVFQRDVGHFWGSLETRPYMRARLGLAHSLWSGGRREEAVQHLQDMLRLNPDDNQGVRYTLAGFLLFLDRDADLAALLERYPEEGSAAWAYTKALLAFRQTGDNIKARQLLKQARKTNKHVPAYLLGEKYPPAEEPGYYSPGDESEALEYVGGFMAGWKSTPGAVAWLRENVKKKQKAAPEPKGPLDSVKDRLTKNLPQEHDMWQADFRQMPNWVKIGSTLESAPWVMLVTSRSNELALAHQMPAEAPSAAQLWDTLVEAIQHPVAGEAHRPSELQVRRDERWESLRTSFG